jgi:hypothetical protein
MWAAVDRRGVRGKDGEHEGQQAVWRLGPEETRRIDFGSPQRSARIRGRIVTLSGANIALRGVVSARADCRDLVRSARGRARVAARLARATTLNDGRGRQSPIQRPSA